MTVDLSEVQGDLTTEVPIHFRVLTEPGLHGLVPDDMIPYLTVAGVAILVLGVLLIISLIMGFVSLIWRIRDSKFVVSRREVRKMAKKAMLEKQKEDNAVSTGTITSDDKSDDVKKG